MLAPGILKGLRVDCKGTRVQGLRRMTVRAQRCQWLFTPPSSAPEAQGGEHDGCTGRTLALLFLLYLTL